MKNLSVLFILILFTISLTCGCNKIGPAGQQKAENPESSDKPREPIILNAKMIDNIAIPVNSEIISDKKDNEDSRRQRRTIELKVSAAVYDVANFYRTEMPKIGWTISKRNSKTEDVDSIISNLEFNNEKEEVDMNIVNDGDDKSQITIRIGESLEYRQKNRKQEVEDKTDKIKNGFPMPSCADGSNTLMEPNSLTLTAECAENISSVSKFFIEMAPQNDWVLKEQTGKEKDADSVILIFNKGNQKALVTLIKNNEKLTSLNVRISK